jgi:hypothetical protein
MRDYYPDEFIVHSDTKERGTINRNGCPAKKRITKQKKPLLFLIEK